MAVRYATLSCALVLEVGTRDDGVRRGETEPATFSTICTVVEAGGKRAGGHPTMGTLVATHDTQVFRPDTRIFQSQFTTEIGFVCKPEFIKSGAWITLPGHWHSSMVGPTVADAMLDNLVQKAHKIELSGQFSRHPQPQPPCQTLSMLKYVSTKQQLKPSALSTGG